MSSPGRLGPFWQPHDERRLWWTSWPSCFGATPPPFAIDRCRRWFESSQERTTRVLCCVEKDSGNLFVDFSDHEDKGSPFSLSGGCPTPSRAPRLPLTAAVRLAGLEPATGEAWVKGEGGSKARKIFFTPQFRTKASLPVALQ